jgi:hypothetical protein
LNEARAQLARLSGIETRLDERNKELSKQRLYYVKQLDEANEQLKVREEMWLE